MSLPFAYKPYVIEKQFPGWPPCGTYIDGGVWNNLPFREIGELGAAPPAKKSHSAAAPVTEPQAATTALRATIERRNTLGLRLEIVPPEQVRTGADLVAKFLGLGLTAGESQVIADIEPFTLILDTEGLDLLTFAPDDETKRKVKPRSRRAMYRYFSLEPPEADADIADDLRVKEIMSRSVCR